MTAHLSDPQLLALLGLVLALGFAALVLTIMRPFVRPPSRLDRALGEHLRRRRFPLVSR